MRELNAERQRFVMIEPPESARVVLLLHDIRKESLSIPQGVGEPQMNNIKTRSSDSERQLNACLRSTDKLLRAHGGCLGDERR
jgi:hypothetical protein